MMIQRKNCSGFTFIELAVVVTIIAILITGILGGKMLIRSAKQKTIISEMQEFRTALYNFQQQYDALPGDMRNATEYWSGTANGDGSGIIGDIKGGMMTWIGWQTEGMRAMQQLALAQFIPGDFSGIYPGAGTIGYNIAPSKLSNTGIYFWCCDTSGIPVGHFLRWGGKGPDSAYNMPRQSILTPSETSQIDNKIDDGFPFSGKVFGHRGKDQTGNWVPLGQCITIATTPPSYILSQTEKKCFTGFKPDDALFKP